jgi:hypothetical protein
MSRDEWVAWIKVKGSGTLQRAVERNMAWHDMAIHERLAMEIAVGAELIPPTRICLGQFKAYPDCPVTTELNFYARAFEERHPGKTAANPVYFFWEPEGSELLKEGGGLEITGLHRDWFPMNRVLFIPFAHWDRKTKTWGPGVNPL